MNEIMRTYSVKLVSKWKMRKKHGAVLMVGKYNLFNLMGCEPEAKLKHILATVDIDYQQHFPAGVNHESTKEAVLTNILNSLQTSKKIITFKHLIESNFATDPN
ncbi:MAG TPA: hypothetical protein PLD88_03615, partial [Candidatus Berkiella sp.]|nr:hypothetical protein [Candidatus Berkiella sp.]